MWQERLCCDLGSLPVTCRAASCISAGHARSLRHPGRRRGILLTRLRPFSGFRSRSSLIGMTEAVSLALIVLAMLVSGGLILLG